MKLIINNQELAVIVMKNYKSKLLGLMFKKELITKAYLFTNCNGIHTFFMKQNIDVCVLDKDYKIIYLKENIKPYFILWPIKHGKHTIELPLKTVKNLKIGQKIEVIN